MLDWLLVGWFEFVGLFVMVSVGEEGWGWGWWLFVVVECM